MTEVPKPKDQDTCKFDVDFHVHIGKILFIFPFCNLFVYKQIAMFIYKPKQGVRSFNDTISSWELTLLKIINLKGTIPSVLVFLFKM